MKKHSLLLLGLSLLITGTANISQNIAEANATAGSIEITINNADFLYDTDSFDRMGFKLYNKENVAITNNGVRDQNTSLIPTVCFNGADYQFKNVTQGQTTLNGYVSMMSQQIPADGSYWPMFFKHAAGQGESGNASWYPTDYPGFPKSEESSIKFYANTIIGSYKILNEFTLRVERNAEQKVTSFAFIYSPHEVSVSDATVTKTYTYNSKLCASLDSTLVITPDTKPGYVVQNVNVIDSDGNEIAKQSLGDGKYSIVMPNKDISISVNYVETTYSITFEGEEVTGMKYGELIGTIPEGKWEIDGYPISSKSIFVWKENKTAVRTSSNVKTYKCECYVDGELYKTVTFTDESISINLPNIPLKEGYSIIGWDLEGVEYKDLKTNAIYELID